MNVFLHDPESGYWIEVIEVASPECWVYLFNARQQLGDREPVVCTFEAKRPCALTLDEIKDMWLNFIESTASVFEQQNNRSINGGYYNE